MCTWNPISIHSDNSSISLWGGRGREYRSRTGYGNIPAPDVFGVWTNQNRKFIQWVVSLEPFSDFYPVEWIIHRGTHSVLSKCSRISTVPSFGRRRSLTSFVPNSISKEKKSFIRLRWSCTFQVWTRNIAEIYGSAGCLYLQSMGRIPNSVVNQRKGRGDRPGGCLDFRDDYSDNTMRANKNISTEGKELAEKRISLNVHKSGRIISSQLMSRKNNKAKNRLPHCPRSWSDAVLNGGSSVI